MPDETGTKAPRSDAPSVDDSLFGEAADTPVAGAGEQDPAEETGQDRNGAEDAKTADAEGEAAETREDATEDAGQAEAGEDAPANELKVVLSIKGGRAVIGVQKPASDPHIESFDDLDESGLAQEVPAVIERARARWEESPKHPAYERPAPPAKRRTRRQQGAAQDANAEGAAEQEQAQQTLRLF